MISTEELIIVKLMSGDATRRLILMRGNNITVGEILALVYHMFSVYFHPMNDRRCDVIPFEANVRGNILFQLAGLLVNCCIVDPREVMRSSMFHTLGMYLNRLLTELSWILPTLLWYRNIRSLLKNNTSTAKSSDLSVPMSGNAAHLLLLYFSSIILKNMVFEPEYSTPYETVEAASSICRLIAALGQFEVSVYMLSLGSLMLARFVFTITDNGALIGDDLCY